MPNYICVTCGMQYAESESPPAHCPICEDERQYVNPDGQTWTTLDKLRSKPHKNTFAVFEPGLTGIHTEPRVGIGQTALLVQTAQGNILWECVSYLDDATIEAINQRGGIDAIALSHPHFYSSIVEWSRAFGDVPVYVHAADRQWVMRPDPAIVFWEGKTHKLKDDITLIHCGGHFEGSSALHWAGGAEGRGALLTGDTIYVPSDNRYVTFMYSYPNLIPLSAAKVERIVQAVEPFAYDRVYSSFGRRVDQDAKAAVRRSADRYIRAIRGE